MARSGCRSSTGQAGSQWRTAWRRRSWRTWTRIPGWLRARSCASCGLRARPASRRAGGWQVVEKPRPDDIDDWPQYFDDGAGSDLSQELRAGPAHGLQWEAGPHHTTKIGVRVVGSVWLGVEQAGLVARHAFSGLPPWRRDVVATDGTIGCFGAAAEQ